MTEHSICPACGVGTLAVEELLELRDRLAALSRIVRRALASHQLEKLEDARPYLDDVADATKLSRVHHEAECYQAGWAAAMARVAEHGGPFGVAPCTCSPNKFMHDADCPVPEAAPQGAPNPDPRCPACGSVNPALCERVGHLPDHRHSERVR